MNNESQKEYENSKNFWNMVSELTDDDRAEMLASVDKDEDWKQFPPSEKLADVVATLKDCKKVLDYGCGSGWASMVIAKNGGQDITGVEVSENAASMAEFYIKMFELDKNVHINHVSDKWLSEEPSEKYDGIVCSNVCDVLPTEVSEDILKNLARVATKDAKIVLGLNFYMEPMDNPERKQVIKNGNWLIVDGVLRLVLKTDEEWTETLEKYFTVEKLDHFAWPGEPSEKRRVFVLRKK